jgi:hypothetical protein
MSSEPFIICDNLVKIYKVANLEVFALQGLDLLVQPGELMGIVGARFRKHAAQHPGELGHVSQPPDRQWPRSLKAADSARRIPPH